MREIARSGLLFIAFSVALAAPSRAEPVGLALKAGDRFAWTRKIMEVRQGPDGAPAFSEASAPFTMAVVETTERGYVVEFAHGKASFRAQPDPGLRALMQLLEITRLRVELSKAGRFGAFVNLSEFRAQLAALLEAADPAEGADNARDTLRKLAQAEQGVQNLVLRGAAALFACAGHDSARREPETSDAAIPNGTESPPLPGKQTVTLAPSEAEPGRAEVYVLQRSTKEAYVDFLADMAMRTNGASLPPDVVKFLQDTAEEGAVSAEIHAQCDLKTGVAASAEATFSVSVPGVQQRRDEQFGPAR